VDLVPEPRHRAQPRRQSASQPGPVTRAWSHSIGLTREFAGEFLCARLVRARARNSSMQLKNTTAV
jgi:hypothetical protein